MASSKLAKALSSIRSPTSPRIRAIPFPYPIGSKNTGERVEAVGKYLSGEDYDLVGLQEVWSEDLFERIAKLASDSLPHAHYFTSGLLGSGMGILSKHPIQTAVWCPFILNGYPHHIHRGDWMGGKGIGLARVLLNYGTTVNFYTTHLHAEVNRERDGYLAHRICQAFTVGQFIESTSGNADVSVLVGDLNLEPEDLGLELIKAYAKLDDGWLTAQCRGSELGTTCDVPGNIFTKAKQRMRWPDGKRIDYVLYKASDSKSATVRKMEVLKQKVEGFGGGELDMERRKNFSDHEGIFAQMELSDRSQDLGDGKPPPSYGDLTTLLEKSRSIIKDARYRLFWEKVLREFLP